MKKVLCVLILVIILSDSSFGQRKVGGEKYGNTLNLGLGIGYYGYFDNNVPVVHLNYEFDVAKDFTLAPFITFYSYHRKDYRQTVVPIGVKGTYYFDEILKADKRWDFYLAGSLGATLVSTRWDDGSRRTFNDKEGPGRVYLDLHIGTEYHFSSKIGGFLDLSTGVSTVGLSFH